MFERESVPVRISHITHEQMERDEAEVPLTKLTCEISPLTPELAGELHDFVRRTLYTQAGVEVNNLLGSAAFNLELLPQTIVLRAAPDQKKASFTIDEAKISGIRAKRSKKSTAWTLEFTVTCSPESERQLAQLVESYLKVRYCTFADATPHLFSETHEEERRARRAAAADEGESATAH
jgi:hypothetical protein